jgi:hypothetical protein
MAKYGTIISPSISSSDQIPEGSTNLYFSNARARAAVSAGSGLSYNSSTGVFSANSAFNPTISNPASGDVIRYNGTTWVNGVLSTSFISEGSNLFYTNARAQAAFSATSPVTLTGGVIALNTNTTNRLNDIVINFSGATSASVLAKGSSGLAYTTLVGGTGVGIVYDNVANTLTFNSGGYSASVINDTWTVNSGSLAAGASVIVQATGVYSPFTARKISTTYPARVRVYLTNALATADQSRLISSPPVGAHGCLLDVVTTAAYQTLDLSPTVQLYSTESGPTALYLVFTNLDSVTRNIPAVFNIYR